MNRQHFRIKITLPFKIYPSFSKQYKGTSSSWRYHCFKPWRTIYVMYLCVMWFRTWCYFDVCFSQHRILDLPRVIFWKLIFLTHFILFPDSYQLPVFQLYVTVFPRLDAWASINKLCVACPASKRAQMSVWTLNFEDSRMHWIHSTRRQDEHRHLKRIGHPIEERRYLFWVRKDIKFGCHTST